MRLLTSLFLTAVLGAQTYQLASPAPGWENVLRSLGQVPGVSPRIVVLPTKLVPGAIHILEGHSLLAASLGITQNEANPTIRQIRDISSPDLPIIWNYETKLSSAKLDANWQVRAKDRWTGEPVLAIRTNPVALWTATPIGDLGYERYPFLPQALLAAGLEAKVHGRNLWAFFDASFRQRVDLPYLVAQWKRAGIGTIHVTSWQFDNAPGDRLEQLIELCHQNLIFVYAWVELPHVSEPFWVQHPECRERTATGMEATLDWRRLINLVNPKCSAAAERNIVTLLNRFDWDGVNLGELYFESLEGAKNPARFTPFNDDVRAAYKAKFGNDPLDDLTGDKLPRLLQYRADLAASLQAAWLAKLNAAKAGLDVILTHIDDRFDTDMRDALGADAARLLRQTEGQGTGFLIEDPATVWHLGPARYREIRKRYEGLTQDPSRLAIDLNIVDRYQDVYPTKRQTGAELAQLVHEAAAAFSQVALYFEYSLRPIDLPLLGMAAAQVTNWQVPALGQLNLTLARPARLQWQGPAKVNGIVWPLSDGKALTLPAGAWHIESSTEEPLVRVEDSNANILAVRAVKDGYEIDYESRATATFLSSGTRLAAPRGKGMLRLSAPPFVAPAAHSSTQALPRH